MEKLDKNEMDQVTGGLQGKQADFDGPVMTVEGISYGWLALRSSPDYNPGNEIGQLNNGDEVQIVGNDSGNGYSWVYSKRINKTGWVNSSYLC